MAFDLDAYVADQLAAGTPFEFTFGGETYILPSQPDPRAAVLYDGGLYGEAFRLMLGQEQYERFVASQAPLVRDAVLEVLKRHAKHAGANLGESSASSVSSVNTVTRSRPTSNGSTDSTSASLASA